MIGKVLYKENLAGDVWQIGIGFGGVVKFVPGQYMKIKVAEGIQRMYSIASMPGRESIELVVDTSPMGVGSKYISSLVVGDNLEMEGVCGTFVVSDRVIEESDLLLFVASGSGIIPLVPMIRDLLENKKYQGQVRLLWGMRKEEDLYWVKEIENIVRDNENLKFDLVLSQPSAQWPGLSGHVQDVIEKMDIERYKVAVYLCGAPLMIAQVSDMMVERGVNKGNVFFESFA